jgi:hypothetical protein
MPKTWSDVPVSLDGLLRLRLRLLQQLTEVNAGIDAFKVKCATCDAMLLPKQKCTRCSEAEMFVEEAGE